jgi:hypothetical protein
MSITDDRIKNIEGRLTGIESKFNLAVTVALFLGISVAGLGAWVKSEAGKVSKLHQDVTELQPFVMNARSQLEKTGLEQINLIQTKAEPIVTQLTKQNLDRMSSNGSATGEGVAAQNKYGNKDFGTTEISCPAGHVDAMLDCGAEVIRIQVTLDQPPRSSGFYKCITNTRQERRHIFVR